MTAPGEKDRVGSDGPSDEKPLVASVFPICQFRLDEGSATITRLAGTGFFIDSNGLFLTAGHVLMPDMFLVQRDGHHLGICPSEVGGARSFVATVGEFDVLPGCDVMVGRTKGMKSNTTYVVEEQIAGTWKEVAAVGYPDAIVNVTPQEFQLQTRGHRGYVQREVPAGRLPPNMDNPALFEVNFPLSLGMSGSPLFVSRGRYDAVLGVCTGSLVTDEGGLNLAFGIAHDLRPFLEWTPTFLEVSLGEVGQALRSELEQRGQP